jgi:hypothetical protein
MHLTGVCAADYNTRSMKFWTDVYGFDMSCMLFESERITGGSLVDTIDAAAIATDEVGSITSQLLLSIHFASVNHVTIASANHSFRFCQSFISLLSITSQSLM